MGFPVARGDPAWKISDVPSTITFPMNNRIDLKSALLGLLLGILAVVGIAAASAPGHVGRYQVGGTGAHAVIVDTATGQAWSAFLSSVGGKTDSNFYQPKN